MTVIEFQPLREKASPRYLVNQTGKCYFTSPNTLMYNYEDAQSVVGRNYSENSGEHIVRQVYQVAMFFWTLKQETGTSQQQGLQLSRPRELYV